MSIQFGWNGATLIHSLLHATGGPVIRVFLPHNGAICILLTLLAAILSGFLGIYHYMYESVGFDAIDGTWMCTSLLCVLSIVTILASKSLHPSMPILAIALILFYCGWFFLRIDEDGYASTEIIIACIGLLCYVVYSLLVFSEYRRFKISPDLNAQLAIDLGNEEAILRKYRCVELEFSPGIMKAAKASFKPSKHAASGYLVVTNRRVIYIVDAHAFPVLGPRSSDLLSQQVSIEDICSIDAVVSISKQTYAYAILTAIIGAISFFTIIGIFISAIGIVWCYLIHKKVESTMVFGIRSKSSQYGLFVSESSRGYGDSFQYWCRPTDEFELMVQEVGAIVLDLQKYGDEAMDKWRVTSDHYQTRTGDYE